MSGLIRSVRRVAIVVVAVAACTGCNRSAASKTDGDRDEKGGMAGMANGEPATSPAAEVTLTAEQVRHGGVRWAPAPAGTAAEAAAVPGQVMPNEDRTARLGAPARGRVVEVRVRPGDRVSVGQLLVTLQSPDAAMAQADAAKATADLSSRKAEATYAASARSRAERLLALKAIPTQDYERALADDELARASLVQAEAEARRALTAAEQLGAANGSASASGEIIIRAPLAGVVLARTAMPGTVVDAGAPLVVVTDPAHLWLTVSAPEQLAGLFQAGAALRFTVPAYPADTFTARIDAIGAGLDPDTRTLPIRAAIANPAVRLKPDMLASALVEGARTTAAVILPDDAVQLVRGTPTVFVATPDGKGGVRLVGRPVDLGPRSGGKVAITHGVSPGDVVVVAGAFAVKAQIEKGSMPNMEM